MVRDNCMQLKLQASNLLMPCQVINPFIIIVTIIDISPELLLLLKVILNGDFLNELRIGAVMDDLCLAKPAPLPIGYLLE